MERETKARDREKGKRSLKLGFHTLLQLLQLRAPYA
jgi:hypothetical protein